MDTYTHSKITKTFMGRMCMNCRNMKKVERKEGKALTLSVTFLGGAGEERNIQTMFTKTYHGLPCGEDAYVVIFLEIACFHAIKTCHSFII